LQEKRKKEKKNKKPYSAGCCELRSQRSACDFSATRAGAPAVSTTVGPVDYFRAEFAKVTRVRPAAGDGSLRGKRIVLLGLRNRNRTPPMSESAASTFLQLHSRGHFPSRKLGARGDLYAVYDVVDGRASGGPFSTGKPLSGARLVSVSTMVSWLDAGRPSGRDKKYDLPRCWTEGATILIRRAAFLF